MTFKFYVDFTALSTPTWCGSLRMDTNAPCIYWVPSGFVNRLASRTVPQPGFSRAFTLMIALLTGNQETRSAVVIVGDVSTTSG